MLRCGPRFPFVVEPVVNASECYVAFQLNLVPIGVPTQYVHGWIDGMVPAAGAPVVVRTAGLGNPDCARTSVGLPPVTAQKSVVVTESQYTGVVNRVLNPAPVAFLTQNLLTPEAGWYAFGVEEEPVPGPSGTVIHRLVYAEAPDPVELTATAFRLTQGGGGVFLQTGLRSAVESNESTFAARELIALATVTDGVYELAWMEPGTPLPANAVRVVNVIVGSTSACGPCGSYYLR